MIDTSEIAARLREVRDRIAVAATRSGRKAEAVRLVLASKTQPPEALAAAYDAGARDFGENYVQEAVAKRGALGERSGLRWHLIGNLQTNKARVAVATFDLIHTLDRASLANALHRIRQSPPLPVLIEVNIGGEPSKAGVAPAAAEALINEVRDRVAIEGLMTVPPASANPVAARRWFAEMRELRDRLTLATGLALGDLSMGMTDDYEAAIAEGATIVRVGRAVFGSRALRQ
jgi:pyridoxal phosphate enzyme (YggS family)